MEWRERKRGESSKKTEQKEDRLSKLPDELLHQIFSSIGTVDAVRTCVLSKRWRYFWTSLPSLSFDTDSMGFLENDVAHDFILWMSFINQVIARRDSIPIIKFQFLSCSDIEIDPCVVEPWIRYAIQHNVQHLQIVICVHGHSARPLNFPSCFYGCESITTLQLDGSHCRSIQLPSSFDLPSLKSLYLERFNHLDGSIFSTCSNLETFRLTDVNMFSAPSPIFSICALKLKSLEIIQSQGIYLRTSDGECSCKVMINAPKLVKFKYEGGVPFDCSTENLISLDHVEVSVNGPPSPCDCCHDDEHRWHALYLFVMLNQFHNAKSIKLCSDAIEYLSLIPLSVYEGPSPFSNLKYLKLRKENWMPGSESFSIPDYLMTYFLKKGGVFQIVE